jgi:hypothetical protein
MNTTIPRNQVRTRSEGQLNFLKDLVTQIAKYNRERGVVLWEQLRELDNAGQLTFSMASRKIDALKCERDAFRAKAATQVAKTAETPAPILPLLVPEGRYAVDTDEGHLAFYRVKADKQGVVTVKLQISDELRTLPHKTAMVVMGKIQAAGIEAAMTRYGKELRVCGAPMCGRTLTNEDSRKRGIGPICADKMGFC